MSRIRTVKPELPQDERLGACSRDARLMFVNLLTQSDCYGNQRGNLRLLKGLLFPYDDDIGVADLEVWRDELAAVDVVRMYEADDGQQYLHLPGFVKNQRITRPSQLVPLSPWNTTDGDAVHVARNELSTDASGAACRAPTVPDRTGAVPATAAAFAAGTGPIPLVTSDGDQTIPDATRRDGLAAIAALRPDRQETA